MLSLATSLQLELSIQRSIEDSIGVKQRLLAEVPACAEIADLLIERLSAGRHVFLFGNGGSASDAEHIAAEFVGRFKLDRRPLPVHALSCNSSLLTAIGNDYGFDQIFARQVAAMGHPGDVAIGISTSGRSENVLEGIRQATERGMSTVAMTGADGGPIHRMVDFCLRVPSSDAARVQEAHILVGHVWSEIVELALFG